MFFCLSHSQKKVFSWFFLQLFETKWLLQCSLVSAVVVLVDERAVGVHLAQLDAHARLLHRRRRRRQLLSTERQVGRRARQGRRG